MKKIGEDRLKYAVCESILSIAARSPFPNGEGCETRIPISLRGGGFAAKKKANPRLAALGSPFQRKGLAWILPPSYGEGCETGMALSST